MSRLETFYFPSLKMFALPSQATFNDEKSKFLLQSLPANYAKASTSNKWILLTEHIIQLLSSNQQKNQIRVLQQQRLDTIDSNNVVCLSQMLGYYEIIYFLYASKGSVFSLDQDEKIALWKNVNTALEEACEPGKLQKYEDAIYYARKDLDWISNACVQLRYQQLSTMHNDCNAYLFNETAYQRALLENPSWQSDGINHRLDARFHAWDAHTLMVMSELANKKKLGIRQEFTLNDIHMASNVARKNKITAYFNTRYKKAFFHIFPNELITVLSQQSFDGVMSLFKEVIDRDQLLKWPNEDLEIPLSLFNKLRDHLEGKFGSYTPIIEIIDDNKITLKHVTVINSEKLRIELRKSVIAKLCGEGYIYDLSVTPDVLSNLQLFHPDFHAKLKSLKFIFGAYANNQMPTSHQLSVIFKVYHSDLDALPKVFFELFFDNPDLVYLLPKAMSCHYGFSKIFIHTFNELFNDKRQLTPQQTSSLAYLYQNDPAIITFFSDELLAHEGLMKALVDVRIEALLYASQQLKSDEQLSETLIKADPLAIFQLPHQHNTQNLLKVAFLQMGVRVNNDDNTLSIELFRRWLDNRYRRLYEALELHQLPLGQFKPASANMAPIEHKKMFAIHALLTGQNLAMDKVTQYASQLQPPVLLWVIKKRNEKRLPTIAFCNEDDLSNFIKWFEDEREICKTKFGFDQWCGDAFNSLREQALEKEQQEEETIWSWLASFCETRLSKKKFYQQVFINNANWFNGFCDLQKAMPKPYKPFENLFDCLRQIAKLMNALLLACVNFTFYFFKMTLHALHYLCRILVCLFILTLISQGITILLSIVWPVAVDLVLHVILATFVVLVRMARERMHEDVGANVFDHFLQPIYQFLLWMIPVSLEIQFGFAAFEFSTQLVIQIKNIYHASWILLNRSIATFTFHNNKPYQKIEAVIEKLFEKNEIGAEHKARLLQKIWHSVLHDADFNSGKITLAEALHKPYQVSHMAVICEKSFVDVAKCFRIKPDEPLDLNSSAKTWFGLFSRTTRSEAALTDVLNEISNAQHQTSMVSI